jgi:KaiC/GvpD/RAD55 family RecA-like ATPase
MGNRHLSRISEELDALKKDVGALQHSSAKLVTGAVSKEVHRVSQAGAHAVSIPVDAVKRIEHKTVAWIGKQIDTIKQGIVAIERKTVHWTEKEAEKGAHAISEEIKKLRNTVKSLEHNTVEFVRDEVNEVVSGLQKAGRAVVRGVEHAGHEVGDTAKRAGRSVASGVEGVGRGAYAAASGTGKFISKEAARAGEGINHAARSIVHDIKGIRDDLIEVEHKGSRRVSRGVYDAQEFVAEKAHALKGIVHDAEKFAAKEAHNAEEGVAEGLQSLHRGIAYVKREITNVESKSSELVSDSVRALKHSVSRLERSVEKIKPEPKAEEEYPVIEATPEVVRKRHDALRTIKHNISRLNKNLQEIEHKAARLPGKELAKASEWISDESKVAQRFIAKEFEEFKETVYDTEKTAADGLHALNEDVLDIVKELKNEIKRSESKVVDLIIDTADVIKHSAHELERGIKGLGTNASSEMRALGRSVVHIKDELVALEQKSSTWVSREVIRAQESAAEEIHRLGKIINHAEEWVVEEVRRGKGFTLDSVDVFKSKISDFEKGVEHLASTVSSWASEELHLIKQKIKALIRSMEHLLESGKDFITGMATPKPTPSGSYAHTEYHRRPMKVEEEISRIKETVSHTEELLEKESHKKEMSSDTLAALKHSISSLTKSIQEIEHAGVDWAAKETRALGRGIGHLGEEVVELEHSGGRFVSKEIKAMQHGLHEVGEDIHSLEDKVMRRITDLLKAYPEGLTIASIIKKLDLARHTVLARLHALVGKGLVGIRKINMAKLHFWKGPSDKKQFPEEHVAVVPLEEEHISVAEMAAERGKPINIEKLKAEIKAELTRDLQEGTIEKEEAQLQEQRLPIKAFVEKVRGKEKPFGKERVDTGIDGLDALFDEGIPKGASIIVAGGAGSGKTILCAQILAHHAMRGKKCLYMSFEESEGRLKQHMRDFGWNADKLEKSGHLKIQRFNPFDITRSVDALLLKAKGELLIDVDPVILPENYHPDFIVVDSLTAIASAFTEKEDSYRIYIEQLFRFFEKINATSFMITETKQIPSVFSPTGVEEFLADGVVVLYNIKRGNVREKAIEVLKLRGAHHEKRIVAFEIADEGVVVYPEQEIFGDIGTKEEG